MHERWGNKVHVIMIYVTEPHPMGSRSPYNKGNGWQEWWQGYATSIDTQGNPLFQTRTYKERLGLAKSMIRQLNVTFPVLIDEMDNPVWSTYGFMPNCGYLIGRDGTVLRRESWFLPGTPNDPSKWEEAIQNLP